MVLSNFNAKRYKEKDAIRILNPKQAAFYWANGVEPLDIYSSRSFDTNEPVIVYIFSRCQTQDTGVYDQWCKRKVDKNKEEQE
jgi:hypothetical protein